MNTKAFAVFLILGALCALAAALPAAKEAIEPKEDLEATDLKTDSSHGYGYAYPGYYGHYGLYGHYPYYGGYYAHYPFYGYGYGYGHGWY